MDIYQIVLHAHSGIRWITLLLAIVVGVMSLIGLFSSGTYGKKDNILAASFVGTMHLQLLLGLVLYFFLSPITDMAMKDMGGAMKDPELRFWAVEHFALMLLAVVAAQIGRTISKKAEDSSVKFRFQAIFFGVALLLMLVGIPWARV